MVTGHRWHGLVLEVNDGEATVELQSADGEGPPLTAEYDLSSLPTGTAPGDIIEVVTTMNRVDLGRWTQGEVDAIRERARIQAAEVEELCD